MDRQKHWHGVYENKSPAQVSWYEPHLTQALETIAAISDVSSDIIDVGGGASTLVDDLLVAGYQRVTVLDISQKPLEVARLRLGAAAEQVSWLVGDVTQIELPRGQYDVWHDRAVFHFLTAPAERRAYAEKAGASVKLGGRLLIATFALDGPSKCSGLKVVRYDAQTLAKELPGFVLEEARHISHITPAGTEQRFVQCLLRRGMGS